MNTSIQSHDPSGPKYLVFDGFANHLFVHIYHDEIKTCNSTLDRVKWNTYELYDIMQELQGGPNFWSFYVQSVVKAWNHWALCTTRSGYWMT